MRWSHKGTAGRVLSLPMPVSIRMVRPPLQQPGLEGAADHTVVGAQMVGYQHLTVFPPGFFGHLREELVRGHDRPVHLLDPADGDIAERELVHERFLAVFGHAEGACVPGRSG